MERVVGCVAVAEKHVTLLSESLEEDQRQVALAQAEEKRQVAAAALVRAEILRAHDKADHEDAWFDAERGVIVYPGGSL